MPRLVDFANPRGGRLWTPAAGGGGGGGASEYGLPTLPTLSLGGGSSNATRGLEYLIGADDLEAVSLRIFHPTTETIVLTLWDEGTEAKLREVTVDAVADEWVEGSITPVTLSSGGRYRVAEHHLANEDSHYFAGKATFTTNSAVTLFYGVFGYVVDTYPGSTLHSALGIVDIGFNIL